MTLTIWTTTKIVNGKKNCLTSANIHWENTKLVWFVKRHVKNNANSKAYSDPDAHFVIAFNLSTNSTALSIILVQINVLSTSQNHWESKFYQLMSTPYTKKTTISLPLVVKSTHSKKADHTSIFKEEWGNHISRERLDLESPNFRRTSIPTYFTDMPDMTASGGISPE